MKTGWLLLAGSSLVLAGCMMPMTPQPSQTAGSVSGAAARATVTISAEQAERVRAYIGEEGRAQGRGRGRGRGSALPPGIEKNLRRGKPLPPGIAKRSLPPDLLTRLPDAPSGLEYIVAGGKLLLVEAATQVIRDVLVDAVT